MKLLRTAVLVGWALAIAAGAASGPTGSTTTASDAGGVATYADTGWG